MRVQSYKRQTKIARWSCRQLRILEPYFFEGDDNYAFWKDRMSKLQTVTHFFEGGQVEIMGSGSPRELLVLEKVACGGVYATDPVVPTFSGPELTPRGPRMRNGRQHEQNAGPCTLSRQL